MAEKEIPRTIDKNFIIGMLESNDWKIFSSNMTCSLCGSELAGTYYFRNEKIRSKFFSFIYKFQVQILRKKKGKTVTNWFVLCLDCQLKVFPKFTPEITYQQKF